MKTKNIPLAIILFLNFISLILLYRFFSWHFLTESLIFLNTLKIPSIIVFAFSIIVIFVDSDKLKESFQLKTSNLFSNLKFRRILYIISTLFIVTQFILTIFFIPPKWKKFIDYEFLSGVQDEYTETLITIDLIKSDYNKEAGIILTKCIEIFKVREQLNRTGNTNQQELVRKNVSYLSRATEKHQIRAIIQYCLAEGMCILGNYENASSYYELFVLNKKNVTTDKWIQSAYMNKGNISFYKGDYRSAIDAWILIHKEPVILSNIAAAYCMLKEYDEGLDCINEGLNLLYPSIDQNNNVFNNLVCNKITIYIANDKIKDAIDTYYTAEKIAPLDSEMKPEICLLLLLDNKLDKSLLLIEKYNREKNISVQKYNLYKGLRMLVLNDKNSALEFLKKAFALDLDCNEECLSQHIEQYFYSLGYSESKLLKSIVSKITLPNNAS